MKKTNTEVRYIKIDFLQRYIIYLAVAFSKDELWRILNNTNTISVLINIWYDNLGREYRKTRLSTHEKNEYELKSRDCQKGTHKNSSISIYDLLKF